MNKILLLTLFMFSSLFAGNNSAATMGDVKEALYILIKKDKINTQSRANLKNKIDKINTSIKTDVKSDKLDAYIDNYVAKNDSVIAEIKNR